MKTNGDVVKTVSRPERRNVMQASSVTPHSCGRIQGQAAMRNQWQDLLELIWSSRYDPIASRKHRIALLEVFLAVVIAVAAGPEIFAAMEMTALMELLGGTLFLTAMGAGARLVVLNTWNAIYRLTFPVPLAAIVQPNASIPLKAAASMYVVAIALWSVVLALDCRYLGSLHCPECRA